MYMEISQASRAFLILSSLCIIPSFVFAQETSGLYMNGQWDPACGKCWPSPRTDKNNHCKPADCAIQGNYHCKTQNPPLAVDDDPRLISLIKSGECTYAPSVSLNEGESSYLASLKVCTAVLDKMAGRYTMPSDAGDSSRKKIDFYLTEFKASVLGNVSDQLKLAMNYDAGIGTRQDRNKATELYRMAANKGDPLAQYAIAARYAYGISMPKDKDEAIRWLHKALNNKPVTEDGKKAQVMVSPCAIKLIERLTPT
jgi:Sel1 repeat